MKFLIELRLREQAAKRRLLYTLCYSVLWRLNVGLMMAPTAADRAYQYKSGLADA